MGRLIKNLGLYLILVVLVVSLVNVFLSPAQSPQQAEVITYSEFLTAVDTGQIKSVTIKENTVSGRFIDGRSFQAEVVGTGDLAKEIAGKNVNVQVEPPQKTPWWATMISSFFPTLLLIGVWIFFLYNMQGGGGKVMNFAKSKAKLFLDNRPKVTFDDVAGCDESKEELSEVIQFLRDPGKFRALGAKVPKGVLLLGPPGTGKTLLARAAAGEADVPFFSVSGSDFVEMFVGVGAARVRDLFEQARKYQPCIIFIDEMDAVGRHRGAGLGGGHDEREQTLNQLLVELDGFDESTGIILIAATNRPDILDPALLRPGRFDRHIVVDRPDVKGREEILAVHVRNKKIADDVDLGVVARRTPGFVGADLANLVNEAALLAARAGKSLITMAEFEEGIDRVIAGPERKSRLVSDKERRIIAFHETGHALVAKYLPNCDPVHKISIIPRGHMALGYTLQLPDEDRFLMSKTELTNQITVLLGGRVAEELTFGDVTTGAGNDLDRATQIARRMVTEFGMSDALGLVKLGHKHQEVFLGRDIADDKNYSDNVAYMIDQEVKAIIDGCYEKAKQILTEKKEQVEMVAETLLEKEVIEGKELDELLGFVTEEETEEQEERLLHGDVKESKKEELRRKGSTKPEVASNLA
ncbi:MULTISPECIES: ATP-dependent zinc metalloprotease FtsH [Aminobacterium]|uniref:ATP-dependent zinc metalloprotease FtsH n=1 Tax=Aminobacterium colombiense (strain DSM 12261 / ALA-1) TaxID=572547 RepID=D5EED0_AMICL|nr:MULTISPECIES: ATP-dependent zinc metalloprotease FtsH [Aminobacterium]MDD2379427.1 ATP-dependent zinc metalloprotease FtsH [Aminobacterium colombiense]ADE56912.1 ATP-dependent metalloprotease FtsH [Aminobacterium colombiense DSM 12261]MDD3767549.1 ATP-dependent zinc metalloprotease FtsH [Aminobacterium colombiense]MDD4266076.1 ATP-dependent zinc metalloprotease FtsH [Aminobacterium colombiense]MDD4586330.1 ATP-dependent zinc metalloprotease FtsH [Aminobacterium colombiense]